MAITADPITAEEAAQFGLIARVTPRGGAVEAAMAPNGSPATPRSRWQRPSS
jgi:enoyl-CoA hydratase/carnithine racemase